MKRFFILLTIISVACSCNREHNVRLLYWNIQNGMWSDQPANYDNFVKWVADQQPDICVWCEAASIYKDQTADALEGDKYLPYNWDELAARYGHQFVYLGGWRDDYPQVITSKYPIRNVKRILGDPDDVIVSHGAGWAQMDINGKTLNIVTLHTWPQKYAYKAQDRDESIAQHGGDKYRAREMQFICDATINSVPDASEQLWLMMGDFNSKSPVDDFHYQWPADTTAYLVHNYIRENTPWLDVIAEQHPDTFISSTGGGNRIDFIYATKPMLERISYSEIIQNQEGGWLNLVRDPQKLSNFWHPSDHRPIVIDFSL